MKKCFKKTAAAILTTAMVMSAGVPAFASEVSAQESSQQVYTMTIDLTPEMYASTSTKTKSVPEFGLALNAGQSGWSLPAKVQFILPSAAKIQQVKFVPDVASINPGTGFKGIIAVQALELTSPDGTVGELAWGKTITDTTTFKNSTANGQWTVRVNGKNISPSGAVNFGSVFYEYAQMTITYTL